MPQHHIGRILHMLAQGMQRPWILPRPIAQIAPADAARLDLDQYVVRFAEFGTWDFHHLQIARPSQNYRFHRLTSRFR